MNDEEWSKIAKENTIKTRAKAKLKTEVFEVGKKVRVLNSIHISDEFIFVKF